MFCSGVTVEASFFGLVVAECCGAVLQTEHCEQYSGGGAVLQQYIVGWGCQQQYSGRGGAVLQ